MGKLLFELVKDQSDRRANWIKTASNARVAQLLHATTVDIEPFKARCDTPDMDKGDVGKFTAPLSCDTHAATRGHDEVADFLPEVKAGVGEFPDTVDTVGTIRLS